MAATVGLAVGLSRSPTPVARSVPDVSPAKAALGYELPGPVSVARLLDWGQPQLVFLLLVALGALAYARGLVRGRTDGPSWPVGRSVAWFGGLAVVAVATQSGLSRYGAVLFSVHVAQFVLLALVAPLLLALGAPLTLALRTLRAGRGRSRHPRLGGRRAAEPAAAGAHPAGGGARPSSPSARPGCSSPGCSTR